MKKEEKFEVDYCQPNVEKEILGWRDKTVKLAKVLHTGSDGKLTVEFTDGTVKKYGFNELGFWEEER